MHLTALDSAIVGTSPRPASFLEQLFKLVESPTTKPLQKALQRAKAAPRRFEFLTMAIVERPDAWLQDASAPDVAELLSASLPHLSVQSYVQLFRVATGHPSHQQALTTPTLDQIVGQLLRLAHWDLTVAVVEELYRSNVTIPRATMNRLLHRASRAEPQYFLAIYDLFQRMQLVPNIVTIGIILLWNATRPAATINVQCAPSMATYLSLRRLYEDGISSNLPLSPAGAEKLEHGRQCYPMTSLPLSEIRAKLESGCDSFIDLAQVFCSPQCLRHQELAMEAAVNSTNHPQLITKDIRETIRQQKYMQAHMMILEGLIAEAIRQHKTRLAIDIAMYMLAGDLGQPSPEVVPGLIFEALRENLVAEAVSLAESCLTVAPNSVTADSTLGYIVKRAFDGGLQTRCLGLLAKMREHQSLIAPALLIQANLLILEDPDVFIRKDLEKLARKSPSTLDRALQCLGARNRHTAALELFHRIKRKSPTMVHPVHYGRALVAAASLNSPTKAKGQIYAEFKARYPDAVKSLELACARGSKMLIATGRSEEGHLALLGSGKVPAICGLAVSIAALPNYARFSKRFFNLFSSILTPDVEIIVKFLSLHLARPKAPRDKGLIRAEGVTLWANFILPWMEHRGVTPTLPVYTRLLQLALRYCPKETIERLAREVHHRKFRLTFSLYKTILREVSSYHTAKSIFESAKDAHVALGPEQYEIIVSLAIKEELYDEAYCHLEALHDRFQGERKPLMPALAHTLLMQAFTRLPLASFMVLLDRLHVLGYLAPPQIYAEFIKASVIEHRPTAALGYFNLFWRACQHAPPVEPLASGEWSSLVELLISRGMVNDAYRVWRILSMKKFSNPVPPRFESILQSVLTADILACLSPPRSLEAAGPAQLILDHAVSTGSELSLQWTRAVLHNSLVMGDFDLAHSLHLHLATKSAMDRCPWPLPAGSTCLAVADLWSDPAKKSITR